MDNRKYVPFYSEENAELISLVSVPGSRRKIATRYWKRSIPPKERQDILDEMDVYVSEKNAAPQRWVLNPSVSDKGESDPKGGLRGVWRLVKNEVDPTERQQKGIYQTLEHDYIQAPSPADATTPDPWKEVDDKAIVHEYSVYNTANAKNVMGIVDYYMVIFPNVAQIGVVAFEQAIIARSVLDLTSPLSQPRFFTGTLPAGRYQFIKAFNRPSEDGSASDVIGILCDTTAATNTQILMIQNWQQYDWKTFYTGVPIIPENILPANIQAVDTNTPPTQIPSFASSSTDDSNWPASIQQQSTSPQSTSASVFKLSGFNFEKETGSYHIEVLQSQAQPWWVCWRIPTGISGSNEFYVEFYNQTGVWVQAVFNALYSVGLACQMRANLTEFKTISGKIFPRTSPRGPASHTEWRIFQQGIVQRHLQFHSFGGTSQKYQLTTTTHNEEKSYGKQEFELALVTRSIDLGPGGQVRDCGNNWYDATQITKIEEQWADVSANVSGGGSDIDWTNTGSYPKHIIYNNPMTGSGNTSNWIGTP